MSEEEKKTKKFKNLKTKNLNSKETLKSLDNLSLGISISIAIAIGAGLGVWLQNLTGSIYLLFVGIAFGIGAAILNIYKAYKRIQKDLDEYCIENNCDINNPPKNTYKTYNNEGYNDEMYGDEKQLKTKIQNLQKLEKREMKKRLK